MGNSLYGKGREHFLGGDIDWANDNIKIALVDAADYTLNIDTHEYMNTDTVPAASVVKISGNLSAKSITLGVADAADEVLAAVTGDECEYILIFKDGGGGGVTGSGTDDLLIACIDTATGLPVTPNGADITIQWDAGANKIFKL